MAADRVFIGRYPVFALIMVSVAGFGAKEILTATLIVLIGESVAAFSALFTFLAAFMFLVLILLYIPHVAVVFAARGELDGRRALLVMCVQCVVPLVAVRVVEVLLGTVWAEGMRQRHFLRGQQSGQ